MRLFRRNIRAALGVVHCILFLLSCGDREREARRVDAGLQGDDGHIHGDGGTDASGQDAAVEAGNRQPSPHDSGSDAATPAPPCLSDEATRSETAALGARAEAILLADAWISRCPASSKAHLVAAMLLRRTMQDLDRAEALASHALEIDRDWDSASPADARVFLASLALIRGDQPSAARWVRPCSGDADHPACGVLDSIASVPAPPPRAPEPEGGSQHSYAQPSDADLEPNPAYGLAAQAYSLYELGDESGAHAAASDCAWWSTPYNGVATNAPCDFRSEATTDSGTAMTHCERWHHGAVEGHILSVGFYRSYVAPETSTWCAQMSAITESAPPPVYVVGDGLSEGADRITWAVGVAFGVSGGAGIGGGVNWAVYRVWDSQRNHGWAITIGAVAGSGFGFGANVLNWYGAFTSAPTIYDLHGWNNTLLSSSTTVMPIGWGFDIFTTTQASQVQYWGIDAFIGAAGGAGTSWGTGESYTWVLGD